LLFEAPRVETDTSLTFNLEITNSQGTTSQDYSVEISASEESNDSGSSGGGGSVGIMWVLLLLIPAWRLRRRD